MELSQDVLSELKAESGELVEKFARTWMAMNSRMDSGETIERPEIDELFRILHTLKGLSEIIGLNRVVAALHLMEDRLSHVRSDESLLYRNDLEVLADIQLLLEKIFLSVDSSLDENLLGELEHCAELFSRSSVPKDEPVTEVEAAKTELPLSVMESETWQRYVSRPEYLYCLICESEKHDLRERIISIGEMIFERSSLNKVLFVFAAELEKNLVDQIFETELFVLKKDLSEFLSSSQPWWNFFAVNEPQSVQNLELMNGDSDGFSPSSDENALIAENSLQGQAELDTVVSEAVQSTETSSESENEMLSDFLNNGEELLESLTQSLLNLENDPGNREAIEEIFRAAHTIKGTAGMLGLACMEQLCHSLESTFDKIRKNRLVTTSELMDTLLIGWDLVKSLFSKLRSGENPVVPLESFLAQLNAIENGVVSFKQEETKGETEAAQTQAMREQRSLSAVRPDAGKSDSSGTIRVDLKRLDVLVNLVGELVIDRTRFLKIEEAMRTRGASADLSYQMAESLLLFGRHMNEVQNIIMKVRMVPVGNAFYKFSRVVRDLSRQCNKEIELVILGGETELDKTMVEEIGDPLVHLIRNCVDHGIESPEQRLKIGKPRRGKIQISAAQQGNAIIICVEDDGKGLDVERIRSKALKNGLIKEQDYLSEREIFNLIFEPGFSTAEKITNISGRGVGMDVVKKNIQKLKGIVEIDSKFGQGTKISIKLPLTLAIIPSLLVEVAGESFAIPLVNVIESIRISQDDIQYMGHSKFVKLRDQIVPLVKFTDIFGLSGIESDFWYRSVKSTTTLSRRTDKLIFVVVGIGHERVGLVVDRLLGQQEIVIKSLGKLLGPQSGLAGGCVLGDGRVALVIDIADVMGSEGAKRGGYARRLA